MEQHIPPDPSGQPTIKIIQSGVLTSPDILAELDIVDWQRGGIYWDSPLRAFETITDVLVNRTEYRVLDVNMERAPQRDDWPDWHHAGHHETLAKVWWNWFHWKRKGKLTLRDSPDFSGTMQLPNQNPIRFWGDFGTVSALAFYESLQQMHAGDLWISIPDKRTQILLSPMVHLTTLLDWSNMTLF